ncbi:MAG TPA: hypothetical protein VGJ60_23275, partial [Chloroflexota bacterium]
MLTRNPRWVAWIGAVVLGAAVGLGVRLVAFLAAASTLGWLSQWASAVHWPLLDPVYTQAAIGSLVNLHVQGIAVAGPPGDWLHQHWPSVFVDSGRAHWAMARMAVSPGGAVLARLLAAGIAHATVLGAGLFLAWAGLAHKRVALGIVGVTMQLQVALVVLGAQPSIRDLQATGVSFAANALLPWFVSRGSALSDMLEQVWAPLLAALLVGCALAVAYVPAALVLLLGKRARRTAFATAAGVVLTSSACAAVIQQDVGLAAPPALTQASVGTAAAIDAASPPTRPSRTGDVQLDTWFLQPTLPTPTAQASQPTHVEIVGSAFQFQYLVNGQPVTIKGMGLNTQYASQLSPEARAAQLDSDMAAMSALGVNTVLGWDPAEFDGTLLDAAQRHGIGVVMPFDLDPDAD